MIHNVRDFVPLLEIYMVQYPGIADALMWLSHAILQIYYPKLQKVILDSGC